MGNRCVLENIKIPEFRVFHVALLFSSLLISIKRYTDLTKKKKGEHYAKYTHKMLV
jgi:hypothetical protein